MKRKMLEELLAWLARSCYFNAGYKHSRDPFFKPQWPDETPYLLDVSKIGTPEWRTDDR